MQKWRLRRSLSLARRRFLTLVARAPRVGGCCKPHEVGESPKSMGNEPYSSFSPAKIYSLHEQDVSAPELSANEESLYLSVQSVPAPSGANTSF